MTNMPTLHGRIGPIPRLPGAACVGAADLFESTIEVLGDGRSREQLKASRVAALALCNICPELDPCRAWIDDLRRTQRPTGVIAGLVIGSDGRAPRRRDADAQRSS